MAQMLPVMKMERVGTADLRLSMILLVSLKKRALLLIIPFLLLPGLLSPALAIDFNAYWLYRELGGTGQESQNEFFQRYGLGVGPTLNYSLTDAIGINAGVSYSRVDAKRERSDQEQNTQTITTELVTPYARIYVINDIFSTQLSAQDEIRKNNRGYESSSKSWATSLSNSWVIPFWPKLSFTYDERTDTVNNTETNKEKNTNVSVDLDLALAKLFYRFTRRQNEDMVGNAQVEQNTHFARLDTSASLWENRIFLNFSQQYSTSSYDTTINGDAYELKLETQTLSAISDPMIDPDPEDTVLVVTPELGDDDIETSAVVVATDLRAQLGFRFSFPQLPDSVFLYLDPLTPLNSAQGSALQWSLYVRNPFDTAWELVVDEIPFIYNAFEKRFELSIDRVETQFMVVAINQTNIPLSFTEIVALRRLTASDSGSTSTTTSYLTNLGVNVLLSETLRFSTNLVLDVNQWDSDRGVQKNERDVINANLQWRPVPNVSPSLSFSQSRYRYDGEDEESLSRSYSFAIGTRFLPTMRTSFGFTRYEQYYGNQLTTESNRYSLGNWAQIYPALNANWQLSYENTRRLDSLEEFEEIDIFTSSLNVNATLSPPLTAYSTIRYRHRDDDGEKEQQTSTILGLRYQPSSMLSLAGTYFKDFTPDGENPDKYVINLALLLVSSDKVRLSLIIDHIILPDRTVDTLAAQGSLNINENMRLSCRGDGTYSDGSGFYNFQVSMNVNF